MRNLGHCGLTFIIAIANALSISAAELRETNQMVLEKIWSVARQESCTEDMRKAFSAEALHNLPAGVRSSFDRTILAEVLNPFLYSLGMSHTKFFSDTDEDYYFFKALGASVDHALPYPPAIITPGVQLGRDSAGYFVREVLDGFPAKKAGLLRGDRILQLDNAPFRGLWGRKKVAVSAEVERNRRKIEVDLELVSVNWSDAFLKATEKSVFTIETTNGNIGYVRLWTGAHAKSARLLKQIVTDLKPNVRSLILDLRGGYGGAWWEHLNPFFPNSSTYFSAQFEHADGTTENLLPPRTTNSQHFDGPMVVLINEGVRSGKEALTFQFKKTKRAYLIGTKTPGYFSVGRFYFTDMSSDYAFYLCTKRATLDHIEIEGIGIDPDQEVEFSLDGPFQDSQIANAVDYLKAQ